METKFLVMLFARKRDNRGHPRIFRWIHGFRTQKAGTAFLEDKRRGSKYLYGVLCSTRSWDAVEEFGDPKVEEKWLDNGNSAYQNPHVPS